MGENGSGKTSIIRFFLDTFSLDMLSEINVIIILKFDDEYYCYYNNNKIKELYIEEMYKDVINLCPLPDKDNKLENEITYMKNISNNIIQVVLVKVHI